MALKAANFTRPTRECAATLWQEEEPNAPFTEAPVIIVHFSPSLKWWEDNKLADDADHATLADRMETMVEQILDASDRTPLEDDDGAPMKLDRKFFASLHTENLRAINEAITENMNPKKSLPKFSPPTFIAEAEPEKE